jgi:hypothetical protein
MRRRSRSDLTGRERIDRLSILRRADRLPSVSRNLTKSIWNFGPKGDRKNCDSRKDAKTPSSENPKYILDFAPWRPFDLAQDMLGAKKFH